MGLENHGVMGEVIRVKLGGTEMWSCRFLDSLSAYANDLNLHEPR